MFAGGTKTRPGCEEAFGVRVASGSIPASTRSNPVPSGQQGSPACSACRALAHETAPAANA